MTNQQGAPEALRPITRYEVVDCIDSKHVPAVIPNRAGPWVRYEDHVAALVEAQQPAPSAAAAGQHFCPGIPRPGCNYLAQCESVCNKCGKLHSTRFLEDSQPAASARRWSTYEQAIADPIFQTARSIMGTENIGQDRQLVKAINHVIDSQPSPTPQADSAPHPIDPAIAADLERSDWTPEEALRWYAAGKHYDTVPNGDGSSSARILDNGAVASNALKSMSREYAEHKGDVALLEPQADSQPAPVATNYKQALGSTNCMQCCVSYMLGVPMENVPDFANGGGWERFSAFAESKGYATVMLPGNWEFEADYLASGKTERGTSHMVVMNDGKLVHDPHPSNAGLTEVQCVWLLAKKATPQRDDRGAFEACAKSYTSNVSFERDEEDYEDMTASLLWHGWKLRAARAPADSVTAPAGGVVARVLLDSAGKPMLRPQLLDEEFLADPEAFDSMYPHRAPHRIADLYATPPAQAQAGAVPLTDKRMAKRTVTYVCPVCCASLERKE